MKKSTDKPEISNAEFEVLDVLWEDHPATSNEVIARLNNKKNRHPKYMNYSIQPIKKQMICLAMDWPTWIMDSRIC